MKNLYLLAAYALVAIHAAIVMIVITPLISLPLPWSPPRWVAAVSLTAVTLTIVSNLLRGECWLNSAERWLRQQAGQVKIYEQPFVEHWASKIGMPSSVSKPLVAALVLAAAGASLYSLL